MAQSISLIPPPTTQQREHFEKRVRPILVEHCHECHAGPASGAKKPPKAALALDNRDDLLRGGESGPAIVPFQSEQSLLIQAIEYQNYEMPPKGKLPKDVIDSLKRWVADGAPWPDSQANSDAKGGAIQPSFDLAERKARHWAWRLIPERIRIPPIETKAAAEVHDAIDRFILAPMPSNRLVPALPADPLVWFRRVHFDLIGLPPSVEEWESFVDDVLPDARSRVVDRLLASPAFGERWGRHWLDLVRYAESRGHEFDNDAPYAYQYRDYVIRALNADCPYDQFVTEHLAGDLIQEPRQHLSMGFNESILGTGFWHLGEWCHSPVDIRKDEADRFDNMLDVFSKTFLGLTVACARCHDHKFDAITTDDYYALTGFLQSCDYREVRFGTLQRDREISQRLEAIDSEFRQKVVALLDGIKPLDVPAFPEAFGQQGDGMIRYWAGMPMHDWNQDGFVFGSGPVETGRLSVGGCSESPCLDFCAVEGARNDPFWDILQAAEIRSSNNRGALANIPRSGRTLRSPTFEMKGDFLECRVRGKGTIVACVDSHRMVAGPLHGETIKRLEDGKDFQWVRLNLARYRGHRLHLEFTPAIGERLEILCLAQGIAAGQREAFQDWEHKAMQAVQAYEERLKERRSQDAPLDQAIQSVATQWSQRRETLRREVEPTSPVAMAMWDGTGEEAHVFIRGNSSKPGRMVSRRFLSALDGGEPLRIRQGSGRLELAQRILSRDNPLTSRVMANRIWHYLMGRGLVPTTDDFGRLGQPPTHPELLDHLAATFRDEGWSIKSLIRRIVLSDTYQRSDHAHPESLQQDPENLYWHFRPPRRLEGEVLRDAMLCLAGRLDRTMDGPSVPVHLTSFMDGRGKPDRNGPRDGDGRRSIYLEVRRNFISPFLLAFDTPVPFSTMGRRNQSNVPAQSLALMNDPLVKDLTTAWAHRSSQAEDRMRWLYRTALGREPRPGELAIAASFLGKAMHDPVGEHDQQLWADWAHALINSKEFVFLR